VILVNKDRGDDFSPSVITIVPIIASKSIIEVVNSHIAWLVYIILPIAVISINSPILPSHLSQLECKTALYQEESFRVKKFKVRVIEE
jgi:hypothetical protein